MLHIDDIADGEVEFEIYDFTQAGSSPAVEPGFYYNIKTGEPEEDANPILAGPLPTHEDAIAAARAYILGALGQYLGAKEPMNLEDTDCINVLDEEATFVSDEPDDEDGEVE